MRAETFNRYFDKPLPSSTFHDLVNKGKIIPFKDIDHAQRVAATYRDRVEAMDEITLRLAYFNGVLDVMHIAEREGV